MKDNVYYYSFKRNDLWLIFNIVFALFMLLCLNCQQCYAYPQTFVLIGVAAFSIGVWCYKYMCKHIMAVVTDESIKIDHTQPLKWKDIEKAEERIINCCGKKKIIVLLPKKGIDYKYNWLQKHNGEFTAFSIPLYGILSAEDEAELTKLIAKKVKLTKLK